MPGQLVDSKDHPRIRTVSATTQLAVNDRTIKGDATAGIFTITLPNAKAVKGETIKIMKTDATGNDITVEGKGSQTINGALNRTLGDQYDTESYTSDGANWFIFAALL